MLLYVIPAVLLLALAGTYLYYFFLRLLSALRLRRELLHAKGLAVLLAGAALVWALRMRSAGAVVVGYFFSLALLSNLLHAVLRRRGRLSPRLDRLYRLGLVPLALTAALMGYGVWNMGHLVETDYAVSTAKAIRPEGYRIALIADLHYGTALGADALARCAEAIAAQEPDLVAVCGDLVDYDTTAADLDHIARTLGGIPSEFGTFFVFGNHDQLVHAVGVDFTPEDLAAALEARGVRVLRDESAALPGGLTVIGRQDAYNMGGAPRAGAEALLAGVDKSDFLLLLDHQPVGLRENAALGYDLQLSGHTHAGQIWPMGHLSQLFGFNELSYGRRGDGDFTAIVTSGAAGWGCAIKIGARSEYVIVDVLPAA